MNTAPVVVMCSAHVVCQTGTQWKSSRAIRYSLDGGRFRPFFEKQNLCKLLKKVARPTGFEPVTFGFVVRSLHLTKTYQMVKNKAF